MDKTDSMEKQKFSDGILEVLLDGKREPTKRNYRQIFVRVQKVCKKPWLEFSFEDVWRLCENLDKCHNLDGEAGRPMTLASELNYRRVLFSVGKSALALFENDTALHERYRELFGVQYKFALQFLSDSSLNQKLTEKNAEEAPGKRDKLLSLQDAAVRMFAEVMEREKEKTKDLEAVKNRWQDKCMFSLIAIHGMSSIEVQRLRHQDLYVGEKADGEKAVFIRVPRISKNSVRESTIETTPSTLLLLCFYLTFLGRVNIKKKLEQDHAFDEEIKISQDAALFQTKTGEAYNDRNINDIFKEWRKSNREYRELAPSVYTGIHKSLSGNKLRTMELPEKIQSESAKLFYYIDRQDTIMKRNLKKDYFVQISEKDEHSVIDIEVTENNREEMDDRLLAYWRRMMAYQEMEKTRMTGRSVSKREEWNQKALVEAFQRIRTIYYETE